VFSGTIEITHNEGNDASTQTVNAQDLYSFPADSWRSIRNAGSDTAKHCQKNIPPSATYSVLRSYFHQDNDMANS
jgi:hypothetical protein